MNIKTSLFLSLFFVFSLQTVTNNQAPLPPTTIALQERRAAAAAKYTSHKRSWKDTLSFHGQWSGAGMLAGMGLVVLRSYICDGYWSDTLAISTHEVTQGLVMGGVMGFLYSTFRDAEQKRHDIDNLFIKDLVAEFIDRETREIQVQSRRESWINYLMG